MLGVRRETDRNASVRKPGQRQSARREPFTVTPDLRKLRRFLHPGAKLEIMPPVSASFLPASRDTTGSLASNFFSRKADAARKKALGERASTRSWQIFKVISIKSRGLGQSQLSASRQSVQQELTL